MPTVTLPVIRREDGVLTDIAERVVRPADQAAFVAALTAAAAGLRERGGFRACALHASTDGTRVVTYAQWREDGLDAPEPPALAVDLDGLAVAAERHLHDVAYAHDRSPAGVTAIDPANRHATFINLIHTTPAAQRELLDFVVANDRPLGDHPGYRSANFHRSRDGRRVVNYSHWDREQSLLDAVGRLVGADGLTMEQANELAGAAAGGRGWTDFRFYRVVGLVTA